MGVSSNGRCTRLTLPPRFVKTRIVRRSPVRWVLFAAIAIGAITIPALTLGQPFIDVWSWRQTDVAAIARNYLHNGFHFAFPQIDWAGATAGFVGTEFPILPFAAALFYKVAGIHEWIGRGQSLLFFALSLPFFFWLVRRVFDEQTAGWALFFYSFTPLSLMLGRCFMPDMPSLSLCIVGLYFFLRWVEAETWSLFWISATTISVAILIKLPSAVIGAPLACLAFERFGLTAIRRPSMWLFGVIVLAPAAAWYLHAADVAHRFYPHHFFGAGGVRLMPLRWYMNIATRMITCDVTAVPMLLAIAGLFAARRYVSVRSSLFHWWLGAMLLFVIVVGYGNRHSWYQFPFVPIFAAFAGAAMTFVQMKLERRPVIYVGVALIVTIIFGWQAFHGTATLMRPAAADLRTLGLALKEITPAGSFIITADYGDPTALYYAERKGWHFTERNAIYNAHPLSSASAIADLERLRKEGATHIAFYSGTVWWLQYYDEFTQHLVDESDRIEKTSAYQIYQLRR